jgi:hypothetical protein
MDLTDSVPQQGTRGPDQHYNRTWNAANLTKCSHNSQSH